MTTRQTSDNVKQLEQLAFDAGVNFVLSQLEIPVSNSMLPTPLEREEGMEIWRQLAITRSLEKQIMNG